MDWGYKAALTATTVALLLTVAHTFGRRVAGVLAGLPTVTGPALIWLALDLGPGYAVQASIGSVAACALCALFALAYECASRHAGIGLSLALACTASLLAAASIGWLDGNLSLALLVAGVVSVGVFAGMPDALDEARSVRRLRGELWLTAAVSGLVSGGVALAAPQVGGFWAGVLASPPLIAAAVAMHQHAFEGNLSVRRFLRGYVAGLLGRAMFGAAFALLIAGFGTTAAALAAAAAGCVFTIATMRVCSWRETRNSVRVSTRG